MCNFALVDLHDLLKRFEALHLAGLVASCFEEHPPPACETRSKLLLDAPRIVDRFDAKFLRIYTSNYIGPSRT